MYTYKKLSAEDTDLFIQVLSVFAEAFEDRTAYQSAVPSNTYIESLLSKQDFILLVSLFDAQVVGGLAAYVLEKFEQERKEIYIYDLAVLHEHRRKGIATALIRKLQEIGKEIGAYVIYVQADPGDEAALALYESLGKKQSVYHFDIEIK
jgi:aminoglycoside 3-N-acetyltransferase I